MSNNSMSRRGAVFMSILLVAGVSVPAGPAGPAGAVTASEVKHDRIAVGPRASPSSGDQRDLDVLLSATDRERGSFDADAALAGGANPAAVADYAVSYRAAGRHVSGSLPVAASDAAVRVEAAASRCTGDRGYTGFWGWGWQWALNSCDTDLLTAALAGGGGAVAAVGGVLAAAGVTAPAGAIVAASGGLVAAGAGIVQICKAASYEKQAIYLNATVVGSVACWGQ